ncbi:MAG: hypothetical protein R3E64_06185 [Halioglobus sp.]
MRSNLKISIGPNDEQSRRLVALLRERVKNRSHQELLEYIDQLVPVYKASQVDISGNRDGRSSYHWSEFLQFYDENFIRHAYVIIFRREPDTSGMQSGLQALRIEKCARIELLGRLRFSSEGRRHGVQIKGLWLRYQLARLQRIPLLGAVVGVVANLSNLSRPDVKYDAANTKIELQQETIELGEQAISRRFDAVASRLDDTWHAPSKTTESIAPDAYGETYRPTLNQILAAKGSKFVLAAYHTVLGREPTALELNTALSQMLQGRESKTSMLGNLCDAKKARLRRKDIEGLPAAYAKERVYALPVIGFLLQLPQAIRFLSRANTVMEFQQREIAECENQLVRVESRLMGHYNDTVKHLKLKFVELVQSESKQ